MLYENSGSHCQGKNSTDSAPKHSKGLRGRRKWLEGCYFPSDPAVMNSRTMQLVLSNCSSACIHKAMRSPEASTKLEKSCDEKEQCKESVDIKNIHSNDCTLLKVIQEKGAEPMQREPPSATKRTYSKTPYNAACNIMTLL